MRRVGPFCHPSATFVDPKQGGIMNGRRRIGRLAAATLLATAATTGFVAPSSANAADCPEVVAIGVAGSGERYSANGFGTTVEAFMKGLTDNYQSTSTRAIALDYPAVAITPTSALSEKTGSRRYSQSVGTGARNLSKVLNDWYRTCKDVRFDGIPQAFVLAGYSQGAHVIDDTLENIGTRVGNRVVSVSLFGDPRQPNLGYRYEYSDSDNFNRPGAVAYFDVDTTTFPDTYSSLWNTHFGVGSYCLENDPVCSFGWQPIEPHYRYVASGVVASAVDRTSEDLFLYRCIESEGVC